MRIPWNKGLKATDNPIVAKCCEAARQSNIGRKPWNKGLKNPQAPYWKGKIRSLETNMKISKSTSKEKHYRWNGYFKKDHEGYIHFYYPEHPFCNNKGLYRLHRLVMEKYLGRILERTEEVHHIDKNKENNNLRNFMLFISKSAHRRFEMGGLVKPEEILFDGRELCKN